MLFTLHMFSGIYGINGIFFGGSAGILLLLLHYTNKTQNAMHWLCFTIGFGIFFIMSFILSLKLNWKMLYYSIPPILLIILPLLNAWVDWCSLNITRLLLVKIRNSQFKWFTGLGFVIIDLIFAIIFVFVVIGIVSLAFSGLNIALGSTDYINLSQVMADLINPNKSTELFWLRAMVFSTLVPTLLHLLFTLYSIVLLPQFIWPQRAIYFGKVKAPGSVFFFITPFQQSFHWRCLLL